MDNRGVWSMYAMVMVAAVLVGQATAKWEPKAGDRATVVPATAGLVTYGVTDAATIREFETAQDAADDAGLAELLEKKEVTILEGGTKVLVRRPDDDWGFKGRWAEVRVESGKQAGRVGFVLMGRLEPATPAKAKPKVRRRR